MSTRCPRSRWRSLGVHAQLPAKGPRDRRRFRRCLHWPPGPVVDDAPTCASGSRLVPAGEARLLHPCCTNDAIAQRVQQPRGSGGAVHLRCARSQRLHGKRRSAGRDQQRAARRAPQELPLATLKSGGPTPKSDPPRTGHPLKIVTRKKKKHQSLTERRRPGWRCPFD